MATRDSQDDASAGQVSDAGLRAFLGYTIKRTDNVILSNIAAVLKPLDLRVVTFSALVLVGDNPGLRQSQLADALGIERPNLVVIVDELEGRGLIRRDRVPTDRRAYALTVTAVGKSLCEAASAAVRTREDALLDGISAAERKQIEGLMRRIESTGGRR